jgi:endo-1,4-beta-D-glucanase Y
MPDADYSSSSKVEVQGFAMVAVAYMGEKDVFDKLYKYYKSKTGNGACGLMAWKTNCGGVEDGGGATDGDVDIASALVIADWQWPGQGYDEKAIQVINVLKNNMVLGCGDKLALYPGCSAGNFIWGGCNETDISYYSPAFFRYFAKLTGDEDWNKLAEDSHTIRDAAANSNTGLVPDWQSVSGNAGAMGRSGNFGYDAVRVPYKHCLDYLFHGNEKARAWCEKISNWANSVGAQDIRDGYGLSGNSTSYNHNMTAVGTFAVAASANTQAVVDAFVAETVKMRDDHWYGSYLGTLYLLAISGNMWVPSIVCNKK